MTLAADGSDMSVRLSVTTGSAGDSTASTLAGSLGKYASTTEIALASLNDLFEEAGTSEVTDGSVKYKCMFIVNEHATDSLVDASLWVLSQVSGGADLAIGLDPVGVVAKDDSSAQAASIADEDTAPVGVTFSTPTNDVDALDVDDLAAGDCFAVWVRRTIPAAVAALSPDSATLRLSGRSG
jgi:hypothetical protein